VALGAEVSITLIHSDAAAAEHALTSAFAELRLVDSIMSLYRPDSQLSRLNAVGSLSDPHPYLTSVLVAAQAMAQRTEGAFDTTVQPLWSIWDAARKRGEDPDPARIADAVRRIGWRQVDVSPARIRFLREGGAITLNGIAQGFAADRALEALRRRGIQHALVNSGEVGTLGGKADGEDWRIGVQHPRQEDAFLCLALLRDRCLSTSGDYATSFRPDRREHHILDPRTGRSPQVFSSVSVAARTAIEADALSTAVFVLGAEKGLQLVRDTPDADALLVFKDGARLATAGFPFST
jgi:thiamine biosynthesis lipoprotein